jgi:hypothetical protein
MATFRILGRGKTSGRKRTRTLRVIDRSTALKSMEAEGTVVDECVELPYASASHELRKHLLGFGVTTADDASHPECVFEALRWCIVHSRCARIRYLTDVEGNPWSAVVEPHGFQRSREGFRLRCYLPSDEHRPGVVFDYQVEGWHLYLIEEIEQIEITQSPFTRREYRRADDDVSITLSFRAPQATWRMRR